MWKVVGCMVFLHLFFYCLPARAQTEISAIIIHGNKYVSEEKIRRVLRLKPGDPYDEQKVSEAAKRLYATKEFSDVQVYGDVHGSGIDITIQVVENQKVEDVRFEGNKHIKKDDLEPVVSVKKGTFVRPALLRKDHEAIENMYREKGYYRVSVKDEVKSEKNKDTGRTAPVLVYQVDEGEKVSIKHVDFFGNMALDSDEIRKVMKSREDRWFRGADFKPKVLERDISAVDSLYRSRGFLDAEVTNQELIFSDDGKNLDIFLTVNEGTLYRVGDVRWSGNTVFADAQIAPLVTFKSGDVFNDSKFKDIQLAMNSLYWDRGYIYNSISPEKTIRGSQIDVNFEITEGEPAHIHEINISGNTKTSERVIRRELVINPGEVFVRPKLIRSLREVFNLGFFEGPPEVGTSQANDQGDIDINLKVKEKQTGQFRMGAGFSALNSISGFLGLAESNFLGKGQQVGVDWEFSRYRQNVDLRFTEPWLFGTPTQLTVNVFNQVQNQVSQQYYDDRRRGASLRIGRPFPWFDYTNIYWMYRYEGIELTNFSPLYTGPLLAINWPQRTSTTSLTLVRNSTDSPFRPTTGTISTLTAEFNGGPILGADVEFQNYTVGFSWFEKLFWKLALQTRFQAGVLDNFSSPSGVPDYERFRLGGNRLYGVRGYDFYEIVPEGNAEFLGGRYMQILSYEVSIPLAPTVTGLLFLDTGNTWNSFRGADIFEMKKGAGLGIRIELPALGTVGFDYGYGFDKLTGAAWEPHLSLGAGF